MATGAMRSAEDNTYGDGRSADVQAAERETPGIMMEERRRHPRHRYRAVLRWKERWHRVYCDDK